MKYLFLSILSTTGRKQKAETHLRKFQKNKILYSIFVEDLPWFFFAMIDSSPNGRRMGLKHNFKKIIQPIDLHQESPRLKDFLELERGNKIN
jgi:hypothetical protein